MDVCTTRGECTWMFVLVVVSVHGCYHQTGYMSVCTTYTDCECTLPHWVFVLLMVSLYGLGGHSECSIQ